MKHAVKAATLVAALLSGAAHASTTYDFSYLFADNSLITGTLNGDLSGTLITDISDVHVFLNGTGFSGAPLFAAAWNPGTQSWDNTVDAVVSTVASQNNFIFADSNVPTDFGASNYFYFINDPAALGGSEVLANNINTGQIALDNPQNGTWSIAPAAPAVPLPAALPLLLSALGTLGVLRRRRDGVADPA